MCIKIVRITLIVRHRFPVCIGDIHGCPALLAQSDLDAAVTASMLCMVKPLVGLMCVMRWRAAVAMDVLDHPRFVVNDQDPRIAFFASHYRAHSGDRGLERDIGR
jgi:hypothetical protein